jgi:hypothetical protein
MNPEDLIWLPAIVEKLAEKHQVEPYEVEEIFAETPRIFRGPKGHYPHSAKQMADVIYLVTLYNSPDGVDNFFVITHRLHFSYEVCSFPRI